MLSPWRAILRSYPCDKCGAGPGEPCHTETGNPTDEHSDRAMRVAHCPKCGERVGAESEPGTLCERCQFLREMNTERARKWKRRWS